eukprot:SAG31_NODE_683_length_12836_cov_8.304938_6_plen_327_part_00
MGVGLVWPERAPTDAERRLHAAATHLQAIARGRSARKQVETKKLRREAQKKAAQEIRRLAGFDLANMIVAQSLRKAMKRQEKFLDGALSDDETDLAISSMKAGRTQSSQDASRCSLALVLPCGHLRQAGPVAGWGYRLLSDQLLTDVPVMGHTTGCPQTIVIVGSTHIWGDAAVVWSEAEVPQVALSAREWATPLGTVKVDKEIVAQLCLAGEYRINEHYHGKDEMSIECHLCVCTVEPTSAFQSELHCAFCTSVTDKTLSIIESLYCSQQHFVLFFFHRPFLQTVGGPDVKIVPIVVGHLDRRQSIKLAHDIAQTVRKNSGSLSS